MECGDYLTLFSREETADPFDDAVDRVREDRKNEDDLHEAANAVDPDVVVDFAAYQPADVRTATTVFDDTTPTCQVRSRTNSPRFRSSRTIRRCCPVAPQARDDFPETHGPRKAEGDRDVFATTDRGVTAIRVRPTSIYGSYDYTERQGYWIDWVNRFDRIFVPGDEY